MNSYRDLERELQHIKAAIAMLEKTRIYLSSPTVVADPAYWKARLETILDGYPRDARVEKQVLELIALTDQLQSARSTEEPDSKASQDQPAKRHDHAR
ncbi:hypothetical protein [Trinickia sp.]|uniref:hypothetical protein n=1 Tax=Trinickia sp. TaxID=2571163 RepID=UPI003F7E942C